jgi:rare lipoprotein A
MMPIMGKVKILLPLILTFSVLPTFGLQEGFASWYGGKFNGRLTSSGEVFDTNVRTAAHKTLPFGTIVKVVNLENGRSTTVKINDRGPFVEGRIIDLSRAAAEDLDMVARGVARVSIEVVDFTQGSGRYQIQVGAYNLKENADSAEGRLEEAGFAVTQNVTPLGIIRVMVRGISDRDLESVRARLEAMGFTKHIVREEEPANEQAAIQAVDALSRLTRTESRG